MDIAEKALAAKSWPFIEAHKILTYINNKTPAKGYVLFETGYGPSGLPHIGTFCEVVRTLMVMNAFRKISDIPAKLFCFSDDMDGLRKVPTNIPNQELIANYIDVPLTSVPDPYGEKESFGHYMNSKLRAFLDQFNFEYEFKSATELYKSGKFDHMMIMALNKYDEIMNLMLPTFREERKATYSPFLPICPISGKVLYVPIVRINKENNSIIYLNEKEEEVEVLVTGGNCKLQWKPDFGMRWADLDVDFEMYGKDHMPNSNIYSSICKIMGGKPPVQFFYELFLNEEGNKISKSKGNSISIDEWLTYAPLESLSLFMYQAPAKAKRLYFDVIPKSVDEYLTFNKKFFEEELIEKKLDNPCYHIHNGDVPEINTFGISYSMLLNLASVCNPDSKEVLWGFISQYSKEANPKVAPFLDKLVECAICYYNDFIKANKNYLLPSENHKIIMNKILDFLENNVSDSTSGDDIQNGIYAIGRDAGYENLRDFFKELYMILLGQEEGPRLGTFFALYGVLNTKMLIKEKLNG